MACALICDFKHPRVYWYQTDFEVVLRLMLHDTEEYFLSVNTDEFEFSTSLDGVDYYVNLHLFGAVIAEKTSHVSTGREITVHLPKVHKWTAWPRLLYSAEKSPQIFVDLERLEAVKPKKQSSFTWDEKDFASYKRKYYITQIMPDVPSSGEEDSADEGYNVIFDR